MSEYEVIYKIEITADSHLQAALEVENILKNPTFRPALEVVNIRTKTKRLVDLEERPLKS